MPSDILGNLQFKTFATDDTGDTPNSPCLVNATPSPEKKRLIMNNMYRLNVSLFVGSVIVLLSDKLKKKQERGFVNFALVFIDIFH